MTDYREALTGATAELLAEAPPLEHVRGKVIAILIGKSPVTPKEHVGVKHLLVGHGVEHDLEALNIAWKKGMQRDTAKFPLYLRHTHLPFKLRTLAREFLGQTIQEEGERTIHPSTPRARCDCTNRPRDEATPRRDDGSAAPSAPRPVGHRHRSPTRRRRPRRRATTTTRFYCWCQDRGALARSRSSTPSLSSPSPLRPSPSPAAQQRGDHDDDRARLAHTHRARRTPSFHPRTRGAHTLYHHAHNRTTRTRPVRPSRVPAPHSPRRAITSTTDRARRRERRPRARVERRAQRGTETTIDDASARRVDGLDGRRDGEKGVPRVSTQLARDESARAFGRLPRRRRRGERGWKRARRRRNARVVESTRAREGKTSRARDDADGDDGARGEARRRDCERTR